MKPEEVKISNYDQRQLQDLAVSAAEDTVAWGHHSHYIETACKQAFQLGFTAVGRGEGDGQQHPPSPYDEPEPEAVPASVPLICDGMALPDGMPCSHPGCLSHIGHPCEGCGRVGGHPVLRLGQWVKWVSSGTPKIGQVVQVVNGGEMPDRDRFPSLYTSSGIGTPRKELSYVIEGYAVTKEGRRQGRKQRYWPRVSQLEVSEVEVVKTP